MTLEFWVGVASGLAVMYVIRDVFDARREPDAETKKFTKCALEAARMDGELDVNHYSDEELIRAIAGGLKTVPRRKEQLGDVHSPVRSGPEGS